MEYGSFFGDGAQRGPDFTAEALHQINVYMNDYYQKQFEESQNRQATENEKQVINEKVKQELKTNTFDETANTVILSDAYAFALGRLKEYYLEVFASKNSESTFSLPNYITNTQEIEDLSSFFFWGAWVCVTQRPGETFSYTHNWPFDPVAGNTPTSAVILRSVVGRLVFMLASISKTLQSITGEVGVLPAAWSKGQL